MQKVCSLSSEKKTWTWIFSVSWSQILKMSWKVRRLEKWTLLFFWLFNLFQKWFQIVLKSATVTYFHEVRQRGLGNWRVHTMHFFYYKSQMQLKKLHTVQNTVIKHCINYIWFSTVPGLFLFLYQLGNVQEITPESYIILYKKSTKN